ncbi:MAG: SDR family NAD(P)-dependent oxidoreductase [Pseudomonadota bacterium]
MTSRTLFITGASSGIGAQTARQAVADGWNVGLFARSEEALAELAAELGDAVLVLPGDATDRGQQADALDKLAGHFGSVDAAFANAGIGIDQPGTQAGDPEEWARLVQINIMGVLYTAHASMPHLRKAKGHFVVTGSLAGRTHVKGSVYSASKWFVHGYAGNLALEMAEWGGRCTVIAPGMVDTPFFDNPAEGRLQPPDVADSVMMALNAPPRANVREIFVTPLDTSGHH